MTVAGQITERGLVSTVPTEVYLAYEDRAKEIAARSVTETPTAIKNAILRFALEARLSAALDYVVRPKLTAYELQVLIGTTISGCNMSPDRTFDLPAAWARLKSLGLIDRADGIASATPAGVELVASALTELQHRREAEAAPVGILVVDDDGVLRLSFYEDGPVVSEGSELFAASPSSPASGVRVTVKPLEWSEHYLGGDLRGGETVTARTILGRYQVWGDGAWADPHGFHNPGAERGLAVGKTAAQAHFDAAILSALEAT